MDKVIAFLNKAKSSLTMWVGTAILVLSQIEPVANFVSDLVNKIAPGHAAGVTAFVLLLARVRSLLTGLTSTTTIEGGGK